MQHMAAERISDPSSAQRRRTYKSRKTGISPEGDDRDGRVCIRKYVPSSYERLEKHRVLQSWPLLYRPHTHAYNHTNMRIRAQFIIIKCAMERHAACTLLSRQLCTAMPHLLHFYHLSLSFSLYAFYGMHFVDSECFRNV